MQRGERVHAPLVRHYGSQTSAKVWGSLPGCCRLPIGKPPTRLRRWATAAQDGILPHASESCTLYYPQVIGSPGTETHLDAWSSRTQMSDYVYDAIEAKNLNRVNSPTRAKRQSHGPVGTGSRARIAYKNRVLSWAFSDMLKVV